MKFTHLFIGICTVTVLSTACDDTVTTLGNSLVTDKSEVVIDSVFQVTGSSERNAEIQSRTVTQLLGTLDAKEYGHFSSEIITQFMPSLNLDTVGVSVDDIDSVKLLMFMLPGSFTGDSLVPMGLKVYPLKKQLTDGMVPPVTNVLPYPVTDYYDESDCWTPQTQIYTANALYNDSVNNLAYRTVSVSLPLEFGKRFFNEYLNSPQTFATPQAFAQFFPGLYIRNSFGSGRVININESRINLYYKRHAKITTNDVTRDTIYNASATYMAVTPEVVTTNLIDMELSSSLSDMVAAGKNLLVAPAGYDVAINFPTQSILAGYKANAGDMSVINTLTFSIPVEEITNDYNINPPANVLLVLAKEKKEFFAENKISDNKTSFLASYNSLTNSYEFTNMRQYILDMLEKGTLTADDYTFTLTPVTVVTETSGNGYYGQTQTYTTGINPYIEGPAMCALKLDEAKIKFTYSKQSINN